MHFPQTELFQESSEAVFFNHTPNMQMGDNQDQFIIVTNKGKLLEKKHSKDTIHYLRVLKTVGTDWPLKMGSTMLTLLMLLLSCWKLKFGNHFNFTFGGWRVSEIAKKLECYIVFGLCIATLFDLRGVEGGVHWNVMLHYNEYWVTNKTIFHFGQQS